MARFWFRFGVDQVYSNILGKITYRSLRRSQTIRIDHNQLVCVSRCPGYIPRLLEREILGFCKSGIFWTFESHFWGVKWIRPLSKIIGFSFNLQNFGHLRLWEARSPSSGRVIECSWAFWIALHL